LSKLEIHGFKSFAHKIALTFPHRSSTGFPITAVVGPNGSGKSNVVDAIRWVLGEQSMKHLRGKKHEDIIFSGSETKSRLGYAEVAMTLDNTDHSMPLDMPEVIIARRLYRDGESEYLINARKVRLADVTMLLAQSHMGQRTYSVIGQGMVDHLLLATPKERKEMIDEAAGVRPYELKRNEALNRLASTRENLTQGQTVLTEIEPRLRTLTRMVKRLERREELERELGKLNKEYYGNRWKQSSEAMHAIQQREVLLKPKLTELTTRRTQLQERLRTIEKEKPVSTKLMELQHAYEKASREREEFKEQYWKLKAASASRPAAPIQLKKIEVELQTVIDEHEGLLKRLMANNDPAATAALFEGFIKKLRALLQKHASPMKPPSALRASSSAKATEDRSEGQQLDSPELLKMLDLIQSIEKNLTSLRDQMKAVETQEKSGRTLLFALQDELRTVERERELLERTLNETGLERVRQETRHEDLSIEIRRAMNGEPSVLLAPPIPQLSQPLDALERTIGHLRHEIELIGGIDPEIAKEYATTNERFAFLTKETKDLTASLEELERVISNLDETMHKQFEKAFETISKEFSRTFVELFGGGKAQLVLLEQEIEDSEASEEDADPLTRNLEISKSRAAQAAVAGIEIIASPPGKRLKNIAMLSGGEKALTAIALLCAILSFHPSPFVVLDEVDAALDEANSLRYGTILKKLSERTQFIVITHNRNTMHQAESFYGVTMGVDGISQLLSMKLEEAEEVAPEA